MGDGPQGAGRERLLLPVENDGFGTQAEGSSMLGGGAAGARALVAHVLMSPSFLFSEPAWAPRGVLPAHPSGLDAVPQVVVWVFTPASDFLPQPQSPDVVTESILYRPQLPPTALHQEEGLFWQPPSPASPAISSPASIPARQRQPPLLLNCCVSRHLYTIASVPTIPCGVPDPGGGGPTPNSEAPSPPSPSAPGPWVGSTPSLTLPRPAPIGRLRRRSGHFLLGRRRRLKLWRGKKSYGLLATLPAPHPTPPPATPPSSRLPTELFSNFCDS
nr:lysine-rich arabinogalactan protein 19 [Macaca nemestrina]